jgi:hypothetical protein
MHRGRYRRNKRHSISKRNNGYEQALKHIEEAQVFTREIGGVDKDVKDYFFSLNENQLNKILIEYKKNFGFSAYDYAIKTIPRWKSNNVKMSGLVAKRLFGLLPYHMPLNKKYDLVKSLWEFCGSKTNLTLYVGDDVHLENLFDRINEHLDENVKEHSIKEEINNRFSWLSCKDIKVKEDLLNYYQKLENDILADGLTKRIPVLMRNLKNNQNSSFQQSTTFGKHTINIIYSTNHKGISESNPYQDKESKGCLFIAIPIVGCILYLIFS